MNIYIFLCLFLLSCATQPGELMVTKDASMDISLKKKRYPLFNIEVLKFTVSDEDANAENPNNVSSRIITASEKANLLKYFDLIRFVINTPEFAENVMAAPDMYAARVATGMNGSVNIGDAYNKQRLLQTIRNFKMKLFITKRQQLNFIDSDLTTPNLYVRSDLDMEFRRFTIIGFSNNFKFDEGDFLDQSVFAPKLFKALLIVGGFRDLAVLSPNSTVEALATVLKNTINNQKWKEKYRVPLLVFQPYYSLTDPSFATDTKPTL